MLGISGYQTQRGDTMVLNPAVGATVARPDCPANCVRSRSRSSSGRSRGSGLARTWRVPSP